MAPASISSPVNSRQYAANSSSETATLASASVAAAASARLAQTSGSRFSTSVRTAGSSLIGNSTSASPRYSIRTTTTYPL